jgi:putative nucleotidyltransferase with HDIG domain
VAGEGFEPPKAVPSDLQSANFSLLTSTFTAYRHDFGAYLGRSKNQSSNTGRDTRPGPFTPPALRWAAYGHLGGRSLIRIRPVEESCSVLHMGLVEDARALAERLVAPLGRRWQHVQAVAARAGQLVDAVPAQDRDVLVASAWLHDIGYSPEIGHTRFHPLDGARYLRSEGWPEQIVNLVAHHSGARFEAEERGLSDELAEFPFADNSVLDALVCADLTTGPGGESLTYDERISEILNRYGQDDPVHRTWVKAAPIIRDAVNRTEDRLAKAQPK